MPFATGYQLAATFQNNQATKNPETLIQKDIDGVNGNISISAIDLTPPLTNHRK
jgi:hypothetical protein